MAIEVITWVLKHSQSRNGARLVLIAIADSANENGRNAWPSVKTLAAKANLSVRATQGALKELEKLGELKVEWNSGPYGSNWYTVLVRPPADSAPPQNLRPADSAGGETDTQSDIDPQEPPQILRPADSAPPQNSTEPPADSAPKPSMNRPTKKTSSSSTGKRGTRIPDDFKITAAMAEWGRKEVPAITGQMADRITAEFIDYWRGIAGAKGVKLDWEATWRNWLRREADKLTSSRGNRSSPPRNGYQPYDNPTDPNAYSGGIQ